MPQVRSFLVNFGQAAICTPCDVAFPRDGVAAEADPNCETVVIGELDFGILHQQREHGRVLPLRVRRSDLYESKARLPVEVIRVV